MMGVLGVLENAACGGVAAAGFGVLFNIGFEALPLCFASGALALAVRTLVIARGWSMEAASLVAALVVGFALRLLPERVTLSRDALHLVGCIPMVPGAYATKAILGLFAITLHGFDPNSGALLEAIDNALRATYTLGALGTGLAIPSVLMQGVARHPAKR